ncbi:MAG: trimethylamine methyltransferase family protein, partial [Candidatus Marinimicrobia bacterium]|nr:trimethylamine methyltransferase family protein [Candidatus Neomarinimicrobiota bacterium]
APIIYGGSPAMFDMRVGTTPMGAIETMMIDSAYAQVGKYLGLPTHAYMGLSDSKCVDMQAGLESGMGILMAALAGINVVSGAGMMDFENCQSLEKLVIDNEICGMALRLIKGISQRDEVIAKDIIKEVISSGKFISHPHTLKWYKREAYYPGKVIDRTADEQFYINGGKCAFEKAHEQVEKILSTYKPEPLEKEKLNALKDIMSHRFAQFGYDFSA